MRETPGTEISLSMHYFKEAGPGTAFHDQTVTAGNDVDPVLPVRFRCTELDPCAGGGTDLITDIGNNRIMICKRRRQLTPRSRWLFCVLLQQPACHHLKKLPA